MKVVADYLGLTSLQLPRQHLDYGDRETILYALGVGLGRDPLDERELPFVLETGRLVALPTMATIFGRASDVTSRAGIDHRQVLHGTHRLTLHRPPPAAAELIMDERVAAVFDKGEGRGAIIEIEREARDLDGELVWTVVHGLFVRGAGGFGGARGDADPWTIPDRAPDLQVVTDTRRDQALLYALNGDRNPLHRDPAAARAVGFERPILHGLCTYGIACSAVVRTVCDYDPASVRAFDCRFSAVLFPGETIVTEIWDDGHTVSFRCKVPERGVTVIDNGRCLIG
jgi:acyl dehydratase